MHTVLFRVACSHTTLLCHCVMSCNVALQVTFSCCSLPCLLFLFPCLQPRHSDTLFWMQTPSRCRVTCPRTMSGHLSTSPCCLSPVTSVTVPRQHLRPMPPTSSSMTVSTAWTWTPWRLPVSFNLSLLHTHQVSPRQLCSMSLRTRTPTQTSSMQRMSWTQCHTRHHFTASGESSSTRRVTRVSRMCERSLYGTRSSPLV